MELKEIQDLVKLVSGSKVDELTIEKKDFKISIKKNKRERGQVVMATTAMQTPTMQTAAVQAPAITQNSAPALVAKEEVKAVVSNLIEIKSPMIGTFYRQSSPDKPPFVEVDTQIQEGKVLCIIEAMKLFNEIEAEISGKIVKVLVDDAQPVEYDQPLFLVEPA